MFIVKVNNLLFLHYVQYQCSEHLKNESRKVIFPFSVEINI